MGKRASALAWAARGFRVFPLQQNSKFPITGSQWTVEATTDPEEIRRMWTDSAGVECDYNIAFLCNGWIVRDVDVKDGKPGLKTFFDNDMDFDTLTVLTPSEGYHLVNQPIDRIVGSSHLFRPDDGIDIKSHNSYVVAPGSTIDGKAYTVAIDLPVAPFPEHLRDRLKSPRMRTESLQPDVELDTPGLIAVVAHWLAHDADPAVEGANGDDCTYRVACRIRDFGISEPTAYELFIENYNPRCSPPWEPSAARAKIENAYRYATGEIGSGNPLAAFSDIVKVEDPPKPAGVLTSATVNLDVYKFGNMLAMDNIEARPWIFGDILMRRAVTILIAPGGAGKSIFELTLAAHNAVGLPYLGHTPHKPGSKTIIVNAEDDLAEQSRRLNAICEVYGFDKDVVCSRIALVGAEEDFQLKLTTNRPPAANIAQLQGLINAAAAPDVAIIIVDPLVELHSANENVTDEMSFVMGLLRMVARQTDCAVLVAHHTGKDSKGAPLGGGNANAGRGSSTIPAAARTVIELRVADEQDCLSLGITETDRRQYVRLEGGKKSYSVLTGQAGWLKWHSHKLSNGDSVGVLKEHDAAASYDHAAIDLADRLIARMILEGSASVSIEEAVTILVQVDPMGPQEDREVVKKRMSRLLMVPRGSGAAKVMLAQSVENGRKVARVVMR